MSPVGSPGTALEEIEYLARSSNRITILEVLSGGQRDRHELEDETGVSRATVGRILEEFEERGWVVAKGRSYGATQLGTYVAREFRTVLDRFGAVPALNEVATWFPDEGFDFDLGCLAGADVVRPSKANALAPTTAIARELESADRAKVLTYAVMPDVMSACWRGTVEGELDLQAVFDQGTLEALATDPKLVEQAAEMARTDRTAVSWYDGEIPSTVILADDQVLLCLSGGEGAPRAVIETEDEAVRSWAEDRFARYRRDAEPLDPALFTG